MVVKQAPKQEVKRAECFQLILVASRPNSYYLKSASASSRQSSRTLDCTFILVVVIVTMLLLLEQNLVCSRQADNQQTRWTSAKLINRQHSTGEDEDASSSDGTVNVEPELGMASHLLSATDGEDDDDDEDEFFAQDSYDRLPLASDSVLAFDDEDESDVQVKDSDFRDFDDHEALQTHKFYSKLPDESFFANKTRFLPDKKLAKSKLKGNRAEQKIIAAGSTQASGRSPSLQASSCIASLQRGDCVTYSMVEWAISRARSELGFTQPADVNSLEPGEASINAVGELVETTTRLLTGRLGLTADEVESELGQVDIGLTSLRRSCPLIFRQTPTCPMLPDRYRSPTGRCNNLIWPYRGSSNMPFVRMLPSEYADAIGLPRRSPTTGNELPPVRLVSLNLHPDVDNHNDDLSMLFMSWGQLINHDLALASGARDQTGHTSACCPVSSSRQRAMWSRLDRMAQEVCMPVEMSPMDPFYSQYNVRCHDFKRSISGLRPGCTLGPRTQTNSITSFVDASFVYGSQASAMESLRAGRRGLLATWNYFTDQGLKALLPPQINEPDLECIGRSRGRYCFRSGDARTNQQVPLAALHTIHTRQHNRLARALSQLNPHWSDELIYQEARHIHVAMVQHILLNEYLPALLGKRQCIKYSLVESALGSYWDKYEPEVDPSISQEFAAAAFRYGHSTIASLVYRFNNLHEPRRVYQLRQLFRQPWPLFEPGAMDEFILGLVDASSQSNDPFVSHELTGHLLETPERPYGFDLVSINLQRGRDQGLASYNALREWCGLGRAKDFPDLDLVMSKSSRLLMSSLYESVDDIDLFTGGLSEFPLIGAQVGPTFACIIGRQFHALRAGDRYWFESSNGPHAFTLDQLDSIKQVSLARLLCANSDRISTIQVNALHLAHPILNPRLDCHSLPDLDISLWLDVAQQPE